MTGSQLHLGFVVALIAAAAVWWVLDRSTIGFAIKAVGANPHAAATAGMSVGRTTIITMTLAGALAGLAGVQAAFGPSASGVPVPLSPGIVGSIGFDAITVPLLGQSKPVGTVLAGCCSEHCTPGVWRCESIVQTPLTLTTVLQALIVLFVAAPALVTKIVPFVNARKTRAPDQCGRLAGLFQGGDPLIPRRVQNNTRRTRDDRRYSRPGPAARRMQSPSSPARSGVSGSRPGC